jgi:hypothetical protein
MRIKFQELIICIALFLGYLSFGQDSGVTLQTGDTQIVLSNDWERLDQPENFYVQKRALNKERGIAISGGVFSVDLTLEQYVALGIYGLKQGPETAADQSINLIAKATHISTNEVEKAVQSRIGEQTLEQIKKMSSSVSFEFLSVTNIEISGLPAFESHSKMTLLQSKQTVYSRQFVYRGTGPQQIVQITYASASDDIFRDKSLIDAIKRPK